MGMVRGFFGRPSRRRVAELQSVRSTVRSAEMSSADNRRDRVVRNRRSGNSAPCTNWLDIAVLLPGCVTPYGGSLPSDCENVHRATVNCATLNMVAPDD